MWVSQGLKSSHVPHGRVKGAREVLALDGSAVPMPSPQDKHRTRGAILSKGWGRNWLVAGHPNLGESQGSAVPRGTTRAALVQLPWVEAHMQVMPFCTQNLPFLHLGWARTGVSTH